MEKAKNVSRTFKKSVSESPRISPVENPSSLKLKIAYWLTKKKIGKVITPLKVVQARMPETLSLSQKLITVEGNLSLSKELRFYIKSFVATLNGCSFCIDIAKAMAKDKVAIQKYKDLLSYETSSAFSDAEKAALQYVEGITKNKQVSDEIFTNLRAYYNDKEIIEITWLNALENYYNLVNKPLNIGSDSLCKINHSNFN